MMNGKSTHILVIGAGYGGMMAALRLAGKTKRFDLAITLVNALDVFVERLRLHEWATNTPIDSMTIADMLRGTPVRFVHGSVTSIQPRQQSLIIQSGDGEQHLAYDILVYALGSATDQGSVPGVDQHAYVLNRHGDRSAEDLRDALPALAGSGGRVVVCGGGPTGVEAAMQIKGTYPDLNVSLVTADRCGEFITRPVGAYIRESLSRQGIAVREESPVREVTADSLVLASGEPIPFDLCLWAGGFKGLPLAADVGLTSTRDGRILVDPFLRSTTHPNTYVVGDSAFPVEPDGAPAFTGAPPRMSAFYALVTGAHAADNVGRLLDGKPQKPLGFSTWGQAVALGPDRAVGFATFPDDHAIGPIYRGRLAFRLRAFFVWFLKFVLELERRWPGFFFWVGKGRYRPAGVPAPISQRAQRAD